MLCSLAALLFTAVNARPEDSPPMDRLVLWLKADSLELKSGQQVERWGDSSPSRNTASSSSLDNQPSFVASSVGEKPAVRFDGVDDFLKVSPVNLPKGLTYAVVLRTTSKATEVSYPGNAPATIIGDHRGSVGSGFGLREGCLQYNAYDGTKDEWSHLTMPKPINDGVARVVIVTQNAEGGFVDLYVNGARELSDHANYPAESAGFDRIASGYVAEDDAGADVFVGDIAEILVYDTLLPDETRWALERYLGAKYKIAIARKDL